MSSTRPVVRKVSTHPILTQTRHQTTSSAFFPVQSSPSSSSFQQSLPKPPNSLFYTSRPSLNSTLQSLDQSLTRSRAHLFKAGLLPSIAAPLSEFNEVLPHPRLRRWKDQKEMSAYIRNGTELRTSQYKKITSVLGSLEGLLPYADLADSLPKGTNEVPVLEKDPVKEATLLVRPTTTSREKQQRTHEDALRPQLEAILRQFQKTTFSETGVEVERIAGKDRRLGRKLENGVVRAVGRRKESGAQVWIVPVQQPRAADAEAVEEDATIPGRVIVNSLPLPSYFHFPAHRSASIHPLSLTATLGSFNVFAIAKGGGLAAQADAVAMGLARALVEWERCEVEEGRLAEGTLAWRDILKRAKLLERDPRVVERKKTGQPKARKKNTWVKR